MNAAASLRERAEAYACDATALRRAGLPDDAAVLETIRDELRAIATNIEEESP